MNEALNSLQEILAYIKILFLKAFSPSFIKIVLVIFYVIYSFLFDIEKSNAYIALMVLILLDFITSIWAAKISGEPIRSSKIGNTGVKIFAYFAVICGAYQCEKGLLSQIDFLDESVLGFFMARELLSLLENVGHMGFSVPLKLINQMEQLTNPKKDKQLEAPKYE